KESALPGTMAELADHLERHRRLQLATQVRDYLRPVSFNGTEAEFGAARSLPPDFLRDLAAALRDTTEVNWRLRLVEGASAPTLREQQAANEANEREAVLRSPVVAAAMEAFPGAELIGWTKTGTN
ncbi:MAG: DNA polymerase III subunit gamma/tau, partial [Sphingomonadales bacterium]